MTKFSNLPAVTSVGSNDDLIVNPQGGNTSKVSATNLADSINLADASASGTSLVESQSGLTKQIRTLSAGAGISIAEASGEITITAAGGITNRVVVESAGDLPTAVGGYHPLAAGTEYFFAGSFSLGTNGLDCSAGSIALTGGSSLTTVISYTGSNPFITKTGGSLDISDITFSTGSADFIDDNSAGTGAINVRFAGISCARIGTIDRSLATNYTSCTIIATTTKVFEFTGASGSIDLRDVNFASWTGIAVDLGTASFSSGSITDCQFNGGAANVALSGAASGANVAATGRFLFLNNYVAAAMTAPLTTVTPDDDRWSFSGNSSIRNSEVYGNMYISTAGTTTISGASTPVKVGDGATVVWSDSDSGRVTFANSGRYTYGDSIDEKVRVICSNIVLDNKGAGNNTYRVYIAKNGSVIANDYAEVSVTAGTVSDPITVATLTTLTDTDYLELFVSNETDTDDVEVSRATFMVN